MSNHKIIFTGPMGAGKTTAIGSLSDIPVVKTDSRDTTQYKETKESTTVAMDYGLTLLPDGRRIHLYGTPGQERFDFMWEILTKGGEGLILMLDNTRPAPFEDLQFYLDSFKEFISKTKLVIGVSQMDLNNYPTLEDYRKQLQSLGVVVQVIAVDAREQQDVSRLLEAVLS